MCVTFSTTSLHISSAENPSKKPSPACVDILTGLVTEVSICHSHGETGGGRRVGLGK